MVSVIGLSVCCVSTLNDLETQCKTMSHKKREMESSPSNRHGVPIARNAETLTTVRSGSSLAIVTVQPEDVRRYGSSAAIVLSILRDQGCSTAIPVLVTYTAIGRLCGLDYRAVSRALKRLVDRDAITVDRYRQLGSLMVRTCHDVEAPTGTDALGQDDAMHSRRDGLARIATLRSLLEAVG